MMSNLTSVVRTYRRSPNLQMHQRQQVGMRNRQQAARADGDAVRDVALGLEMAADRGRQGMGELRHIAAGPQQAQRQ